MSETATANNAPAHGGDLVNASEQYGIAIDQWLDLSTGINPIAYPIDIDVNSFKQLPYIQPAFIEASTAYYRSSRFIPVAGTQAAIQQLPRLLANFPVLLPAIGYQEHKKYWQKKAATSINWYKSDNEAHMCHQINHELIANARQHLVIINPNNPAGVLIQKKQLLAWASMLDKQAYLIIDEAFIDTKKEQSVLSDNLPDNVIVLRSFGKFFGLAGVRLGYCFAHQSILQKLQKRLGLWQVNGPAQSLAIRALNDRAWQLQSIKDIVANNHFMQKIWQPILGGSAKDETSLYNSEYFHSCLFLSYRLPLVHALNVRESFAKMGILLRVIGIDGTDNREQKQALLRIGLLDQYNQIAVDRLKKSIEAFVCRYTS